MEKEKKNIFQQPLAKILLAALCTFLWGCAFPSVKIGYRLFEVASGDVAGQLLFAGVRFTGAGIAVLIIGSFMNRKLPRLTPGEIPGTALLGLLQTGLQYFCFYIGMAHTTGVRGSIFNATSTFMTVLFVGIVWRKTEPISLRKLLGCLIGFGGVLLVNLSGSGAGGSFTLMGDGMVLASSACLAFAAPLTKVLTRKTESMALTGWQLTIGGGTLLIVGLVAGGKLANAGIVGVLLLLFMMMITGVAFPIWTCLLKYNPVSSVAVYNFLIPVFGVTLSSLVLGEGFPGVSCLIALVLVCGGIIIVNGEKEKKA